MIELKSQSNRPVSFKQQQPQSQSRERKYDDVDVPVSIISRILWSGSSVFHWLIGNKETDNTDNLPDVTAVSTTTTNILSSWTSSSNKKMIPTQEPTDRPTSSPIKLSTKMGKEGFKTCCSKLWVQMLEDDEAKIFI